MLTLRSFDDSDRRAYLDEIRPRVLMLRVKAEKVKIAWAVPLWALEEVVAFALGAAALLTVALPLLPTAARRRLEAGVRVGGQQFDFGIAQGDSEAPATRRETLWRIYELMNDYAGGSLRDVLRVPAGEPYVKVDAQGALVEIAAR